MKRTLSILAVVLLIASCGSNQKETVDVNDVVFDTLRVRVIKWEDGSGVINGNDLTGNATFDTLQVNAIVLNGTTIDHVIEMSDHGL